MAESDEGFSELIRKLELLDQYLLEEIATAIQWGLDQIVNDAKASTEFHDQTGNLRSSIRSDLEIIAGEVVGTVAAGGPDGYAQFVEFGTGPHGQASNKNDEVSVSYSPAEWRYPKDAKALHWMDGGKDRFAKRVWWQGTYAHPFLYPAYRKWLPKIIELLQKAPQEAARRAGLQ